MSGFNTFKQLQSDSQTNNQSNMVGIRPTNWFVTVKQNMQTGGTQINFNLRNQNELSEDYKNIDVNSFEFVNLYTMTMATGNTNSTAFSSITSNLTNNDIYAVRGNNDDGSRQNLGLYRGRELSQDKYWSHPRLFGILRAVNDKAPSQNPDIAKYCGNNPVPVIMDLTFDKQNKLMEQVNASPNDFSKISGIAIRVEASKDAGIVQHNKGKYYLPAFTTNQLTAEQHAQMENYAKQPMEQLIQFIKQIDQQDEMYKLAYNNHVRGSQAVQLLDDIFDAGISTKDGLQEYINSNGGWGVYQGQAQPAPSTVPTPQPAPSPAPNNAPMASQQPQQPTTPEPPMSDNNDQSINLDDDSLPF